MTSPAPPLVNLADLPYTDYPHGIFSVAGLADPADQREFYSGVNWEPVSAPVPMPGTAQAACGPREAKTLDAGIPAAEAGVLRTYTGVQCDAGSLREDWEARAQAAVQRCEQATLEHAAWTGAYANTPKLASPGSVVLSGPDPVTLAQGFGLLDWWLARTHGTGAIWASRMISGYLSTAYVQLRTSGPRLLSTAGTPVVLAYTDAGLGPGPDGTAPEAGSAWLYATGPVEVRRSRVFVPELAQALNREDNNVFFLAERSYVIRFSPLVAAVRVELTGWLPPTVPASGG